MMERSTRSATFIAERIGSSAKTPPGWGEPCPRPRRLHTPGSLRTTRSLQASLFCTSLFLHVGRRLHTPPRAESQPLPQGSGTERKGSAIRWGPVPGSLLARARFAAPRGPKNRVQRRWRATSPVRPPSSRKGGHSSRACPLG